MLNCIIQDQISVKFEAKYNIYIQEHAFCKMSTILSRP